MIESFETGGSERQFATLARSLNPERFRLNLGCIRQRGAFIEGLGEVPQFRLGGSLYGPQSWRTRWRLARHLRSNGTAVAQAFDFYSNLTLIPAARAAGVSVVVGSQRQLGDLLTPAQSFAQRAAFRWCDAVVCNSRAAAQRLVHQGLREEKIAVIANGLPAAAFAETQSLLPCRPGILRVGMIARMNTRAKNHGLFLRTAARLAGKFPHVEFILVGDGPLRADLERDAARLNIVKQVQFVGDQRNIPAVLASLDVSVLPSASESLSNAILESMAAGVPVVASRVGGNSELVNEERGILCVPGSEEDLAAGIQTLLLDKSKRIALGANARRFAQANFTISQMGKGYEELYTELLARKRERRSSPSAGSATKAAKNCRISVAIVAASLRYVGGQSVQAELLLRHWKNDPAIDAKLIPIDPALPRAVAWVERIPVLRTLVRQPFYLLELWKGLKHVDIAHIFSASYWSFLIAPAPALWIARLRGKKAIIHYHSGEARDHLRRSPVARRILRKVDRLVVPSEYLVRVFQESGLEAHAVPNIVDVSQFSFRERQPLRPHLICTRGFHPYYSVDVVVRAFAEVQKQFPEACLDLVGKGPSEADIRELVRDLKVSGVHFTGVASREEIGRLYDQADIFINASWLDNMPVSILEAFACGTPVVSTAAESISYLVEHERTGLLSEVGDVSALAGNVLRLLRDPALAARVAVQALRQSELYRWPAVREQWLEVYRPVSARKEAADRIAVVT
ncbi:MAG TPA: glycosyltransferase [Candidatus Sulfotelmatobacter sp.]|nr:glycosyltransferase [Candidatus Sulfotelmatobacter sp.]